MPLGMTPDWSTHGRAGDRRSRRAVLRASSVAVAGALAGCGGSGDGTDDGGGSETPKLGGTPGKDAGKDAYGVVAYNKTDTERPLTVTVDLVWEAETPLEESLTLGSNQAREWNHVLTEPKEHVVRATLPPDGNENVTGTPAVSNNLYITPESDDAPDIENVGVIVQTYDTQEGGETTLVGIETDPGNIPGETPDSG